MKRPAALYGFGICQEDSRIDHQVLAPGAGRRVLTIASGGEAALAMAAHGSEVLAVDIDAGQVHLTELKLAAARVLGSADGARFLGYAARAPERRLTDYGRLRATLPATSRTYWDAQTTALRRGALWSGRFERFVRPVVRAVRRVWDRRHVDALCRGDGGPDQAAIFDRHIDRAWVRAAFRLLFHPRVYGGRGLDAHALAHRSDERPLGEQYHGWFRSLCTATAGSDNWFLQVVLRRALVDPERGPDFLRPAGVRALREGPGRLRTMTGDLQEVVHRNALPRFDAVSLSNLGDWLDSDGFAALLRAAVARLPDGAPLLWRELQTVRHPPEDAPLVEDRARGERLREHDRFPFYRIVPTTVRRAA